MIATAHPDKHFRFLARPSDFRAIRNLQGIDIVRLTNYKIYHYSLSGRLPL
jgi:hypothetical protein